MSICQILGLWTNETEKDRENMMLSVFRLEEYFSPWEFKAPYLLCCSDAESRSLEEILSLADDRSKLLWSRLHLGYTEVKGLPILRNEIAKLYQGLELENVVCFAGAEEGIFCSMQALVKEGDHVIVLTPCYQSSKTYLIISERVSLPCDSRKRTCGRWTLTPSKMHSRRVHDSLS
jgi:histidinol-phosphate/aromatic aminotransferase/cobyric acid decarboxylase-like protein